jgi:hypothetical protein
MIPWFDPDAFQSGTATLESLTKTVAGCDFAILLLADDDLQQIGNQPVHRATRDNVLFELGLCMGLLGRDHVFFFFSNSVEFKMPSDLIGITGIPISFNPDAVKDKGPLKAACSQILTRMNQVAEQDAVKTQQARARLDLRMRFPRDHGATDDGCDHLIAGRFSDLFVTVALDDSSIDDLYVYFERRLKLYHSTWTLKKDAQGFYYYWPPKNIPKAKSGRINFDVVEPRAGEYRISIVALAKKQPRFEKTFVLKVDEP